MQVGDVSGNVVLNPSDFGYAVADQQVRCAPVAIVRHSDAAAVGNREVGKPPDKRPVDMPEDDDCRGKTALGFKKNPVVGIGCRRPP